MKLLCFVDTHGSKTALQKLATKASKVDIFVCAGDFTVFEDKMKSILSTLNSFKKPVLLIHGNHEDASIVRGLCEHYDNLTFFHNKIVMKGDTIFFGWGGGGFSQRDKKFEKSFPKIKKFLDAHPGKKFVIVSHAPPRETYIDEIDGDFCGNKSIMDCIKRFKPILVISGHLHENAGKEELNKKTLIVNPGPRGKFYEI